MTGLDTNILVRYFTKDDLKQGMRAAELMHALTPESPGFVSLVSLIELVWVLRSKYRLSKADLIQRLDQLLAAHDLSVESHAAVSIALRRFAESKADFADCLIETSGRIQGCNETVTFDVNASKFAGMRLL